MKSFNYYDLMELFDNPRTGCAICARSKMEGERYLTTLLYEYANDYGTHQVFRAARGLCNHHAWHMSHMHKGMNNLAVLYEGVLDEVLNLVNQATRFTPGQMAGNMLGRIFGAGSEAEALAQKLVSDQMCPCCETMARAAAHHIEAVADGLKDTRFIEAFQKSNGFCLPHTVMVLQAMQDSSAVGIVIQKQKEVWSKLKDELRTYIDLYGLNGEGQGRGEESSSWLRAIANLAGDDGVFADNLNRFET